MAEVPPIKFFSEERVIALTGLSRKQLRYWSSTDFFHPEHESEEKPHLAVYSFRDVVSLRAIAALRSRVPLQELRRVGAYLARYHDSPWSSLRFTAVGRKVYFFDPEAGAWLGLPDQQAAIREVVEMDRILEEVTAAVQELKRRPEKEVGRIVQSRRIHSKSPVIGGTRVTTAAIWSFHEEGHSTEAILQQCTRR